MTAPAAPSPFTLSASNGSSGSNANLQRLDVAQAVERAVQQRRDVVVVQGSVEDKQLCR